MVTDFDVFVAFRKAQGAANNRPYRVPKNWNSYRVKMDEEDYNRIEQTARYFNTVYSNIDLDTYMKCGFEIFRTFDFKHMLDRRVITKYIKRDKSEKRLTGSNLNVIDETFDYLDGFVSELPVIPGFTAFQSYCKNRPEGNLGDIRTIVYQYVKGKVDAMVLVYCINNRYLILNDDERAIVPYISQNYRKLVAEMVLVADYIKGKIEELNNVQENRRQAIS